MQLRIDRRSAIAEGVVALDLRRPEGGALPSWAPGAHIDLRFNPSLVRPYSLCGDPADRSVWRLAVQLEPDGRGGSIHAHQLAEGDLVQVSGPRNNFALEPAPRYLFLAGGIGITPLLPMLAAASDWQLHYGGRTLPFRDELTARYGAQVTIHPGLLDLDRILDDLSPGTLVYCCGPSSLLDAVSARCPAEMLRLERFDPVPLAPSAERRFEVELVRTGVTVTVPPDRTILQMADEAGAPVSFSCREGTCGTCETPVLDGEVDHRDSLLTPAERAAHDTMFICVSRAAGARLVLDL